MAKKEKLEDINVMEGIDFEKNQRRIQRLEKRIKKQKLMNKIFYISIAILLIAIIFIVYDRLGREAYNNCIDNGYSREYCRKVI